MEKDDTIIKFNAAKKVVKKSRKEKQAAENRVKFGRTKAEKLRDTIAKEKSAAYIENHKRDKD